MLHTSGSTTALLQPLPTPARLPSSVVSAEPGSEVTVLVVDDHRCFAELLSASLSRVPGVRSLGTASSAEEGIDRAAELRPDVVVMDIDLPDLDGLAATRQVRAAHPAMAVAVVSGHSDGEWIARAARAGASAFITKGGSLTELVETIRAARPGAMVLPRSMVKADLGTARDQAAKRIGLTARELEVLSLMVQGIPDKSVAKVLGISLHTCRGYVKTVYAVLNVRCRIDALNEARRLSLVA